jgi:hypothetical protein
VLLTLEPCDQVAISQPGLGSSEAASRSSPDAQRFFGSTPQIAIALFADAAEPVHAPLECVHLTTSDPRKEPGALAVGICAGGEEKSPVSTATISRRARNN